MDLHGWTQLQSQIEHSATDPAYKESNTKHSANESTAVKICDTPMPLSTGNTSRTALYKVIGTKPVHSDENPDRSLSAALTMRLDDLCRREHSRQGSMGADHEGKTPYPNRPAADVRFCGVDGPDL